MKAYVVVYGYEDDNEIDSVFIDKEEAEAYVRENNRIPYEEYDKCHIEEVDLNPSIPNRKIVIVHGCATKDKEIRSLVIERIDRESLEALKKFTKDDIIVYPGKRGNMVDLIFFHGRIDVSSCKDLKNCDKYIRTIIMKKLDYYNQKDIDDKESK